MNWMEQSATPGKGPKRTIQSVTDRVSNYEQPAGGLLPPSWFEQTVLGPVNLHPDENVAPDLIGLVTDYMTRWMHEDVNYGTSDLRLRTEHIFSRAIRAASFMDSEDFDRAKRLVAHIRGMDDGSIQAAIQLAGYDRYLMAPHEKIRPVGDAKADADTLDNVRTLVRNNLAFVASYCEKPVQFGVDFKGAYTHVIRAGEADLLAANGLFDFKASKYNIMTEYFTLQLGVYWRMLLRRYDARYGAYDDLPVIGVFNPRYNCVYSLKTADIPQDISETIDRDVIQLAENRWDIKAERRPPPGHEVPTAEQAAHLRARLMF